jgi:hypothetical protein
VSADLRDWRLAWGEGRLANTFLHRHRILADVCRILFVHVDGASVNRASRMMFWSAILILQVALIALFLAG